MVSIAIVLAGAVVMIALGTWIVWRKPFQPTLVIFVKPRLVVIYKNACCNVHCVNQTESLANATLLYLVIYLSSDIGETHSLRNVKAQMFGVRLHGSSLTLCNGPYNDNISSRAGNACNINFFGLDPTFANSKMRLLAVVPGLSLILIILWDAFETVILPRRVTRRIRLTRVFYSSVWTPWSVLVRHISGKRRRGKDLGLFWPLSLLILLVILGSVLRLGYAPIV